MNGTTDKPGRDVRELWPAVIFVICLCVAAALVLVDQVQAMLPDDRPSKVVLAAIVVAGATLGWMTPVEPSYDPRPGSGPAMWVALLGSSGVVALVGLRREFPGGPVIFLAAGVGWSGMLALRVVIRRIAPWRRRENGGPGEVMDVNGPEADQEGA